MRCTRLPIRGDDCHAGSSRTPSRRIGSDTAVTTAVRVGLLDSSWATATPDENGAASAREQQSNAAGTGNAPGLLMVRAG